METRNKKRFNYKSSCDNPPLCKHTRAIFHLCDAHFFARNSRRKTNFCVWFVSGIRSVPLCAPVYLSANCKIENVIKDVGSANMVYVCVHARYTCATFFSLCSFISRNMAKCINHNQGVVYRALLCFPALLLPALQQLLPLIRTSKMI